LQKNKILKITAVAIFFSLVSASAVQAVVKSDVANKENILNGKDGAAPLSSGIWEDDFNDATKIDPSPPGAGASDNYVVGSGKVTMIDTYPVWTNPAWTRMSPITITNNAGATLTNCLIRFSITRYADMRSDYGDIRFKREGDANWLSYWIEDSTVNPANVWVKIPSLPIGASTLYLFYGNPSATAQVTSVSSQTGQKNLVAIKKSQITLPAKVLGILM